MRTNCEVNVKRGDEEEGGEDGNDDGDGVDEMLLARSSGMIINTPGWVEGKGLMFH